MQSKYRSKKRGQYLQINNARFKKTSYEIFENLNINPKELERWMLRTGILPESNWGVSRSGIFTDFN